MASFFLLTGSAFALVSIFWRLRFVGLNVDSTSWSSIPFIGVIFSSLLFLFFLSGNFTSIFRDIFLLYFIPSTLFLPLSLCSIWSPDSNTHSRCSSVEQLSILIGCCEEFETLIERRSFVQTTYEIFALKNITQIKIPAMTPPEKMECRVSKVGLKCFVRTHTDPFIKLLFSRGINTGIVPLVTKTEQLKNVVRTTIDPTIIHLCLYDNCFFSIWQTIRNLSKAIANTIKIDVLNTQQMMKNRPLHRMSETNKTLKQRRNKTQMEHTTLAHRSTKARIGMKKRPFLERFLVL